MLEFTAIHQRANQHQLGFIPSFLDKNDPRSAKEQFATNYVGGWFPFKGGFKLLADGLTLKYPGDPAMPAMWRGQLRDETILVFDHAWVMIKQADGSYEIARMD